MSVFSQCTSHETRDERDIGADSRVGTREGTRGFSRVREANATRTRSQTACDLSPTDESAYSGTVRAASARGLAPGAQRHGGSQHYTSLMG